MTATAAIPGLHDASTPVQAACDAAAHLTAAPPMTADQQTVTTDQLQAVKQLQQALQLPAVLTDASNKASPEQAAEASPSACMPLPDHTYIKQLSDSPSPAGQPVYNGLQSSSQDNVRSDTMTNGWHAASSMHTGGSDAHLALSRASHRAPGSRDASPGHLIDLRQEEQNYLQKAQAYITSLGGTFDPNDYTVTISVRTSGASAGSLDRYLHGPDGVRLRSLAELARHLNLKDSQPTTSAAASAEGLPAVLPPSMSGRERRPPTRLVASEESDQPQLARKTSGNAVLPVTGIKRDLEEGDSDDEAFAGPRRKKLPNGAWIKLPPRRAIQGTVLGSVEHIAQEETPTVQILTPPAIDISLPLELPSFAPTSTVTGWVPRPAAWPKPPGPDEIEVNVICGGRPGLLSFPSRVVICACPECQGKSDDERAMKCTHYEAHCGRGTAKKWMDSVLVTAADAKDLCGKANPKVRSYLKAKGFIIGKPAEAQADGQLSAPLDRSQLAKPSMLKPPGSSPNTNQPSSSSAQARSLVQWAIRRKRSNTSPERSVEPAPSHFAHRHDQHSYAATPGGYPISGPPAVQHRTPSMHSAPSSAADQVNAAVSQAMSQHRSQPRLSLDAHEVSLQAAIQQTELLARTHNLPQPHLPAAQPGSASRFAASRDPRIASPPSPSLQPGSAHAPPSPPAVGQQQQQRSAPPASGPSLLSPHSQAVSDQLVAEVRLAMGKSDVAQPVVDARARVDALLQSLSQALGDDRHATESAHTLELARIKANQDVTIVEMLAQIQRLSARVNELERSNDALQRELRAAQVARQQSNGPSHSQPIIIPPHLLSAPQPMPSTQDFGHPLQSRVPNDSSHPDASRPSSSQLPPSYNAGMQSHIDTSMHNHMGLAGVKADGAVSAPSVPNSTLGTNDMPISISS